MKLFLSSEALFGKLGDHFTKLVGKTPADITIALIENAADTYAEERKAWVYENRASLTNAGYQVELVDLRDYKDKPEELEAKLARKDALWLNGGNTFYLNWLLHETGAHEIIPRLVQQGTVYGGGSAGILVAGPTIHYIEDADDPEDAPALIWDGMKLIDFVVVPHLKNEKYGKIMEQVISSLQADGYDVRGITDDEAVVVEGKERRIVNRGTAQLTHE